jgi:hypothetical protein
LKKGLHPYPSDIVWNAVGGRPRAGRAGSRDEPARGKSKAEIRKLFPETYGSFGGYDRTYEKELRGRDYLWLGKNGVIVYFVDGKGYEISLLKG